MNMIIKGQLITLMALLTALVVTLVACGGGSSTAGGGGGSGSTIAGTVDNGVAAVYPSDKDRPLLAALTDVLIEPAQAEGVEGMTVQLVGESGVVDEQITGPDGEFMFTGLAPGQYSIRLLQGGVLLGETSPMQVDAATKTKIQMSLSGDVLSIEVEAEDNQISGRIEDDLSSDDDSSDDLSSDDDSSDDLSSDDDSSDV